MDKFEDSNKSKKFEDDISLGMITILNKKDEINEVYDEIWFKILYGDLMNIDELPARFIFFSNKINDDLNDVKDRCKIFDLY